MIPPLNAALQVVNRVGAMNRDLHRWLQIIERALKGPFIGQQSQETFVIRDGEYGIHVKRLTLDGKERATIEGSSRLVICG